RMDGKNIAAISHFASQSLARVCSERVRSHFQLRKNQRLDLSRKKHGGPLIGELRSLTSRVSIFGQVSDIDGPANLFAGSQAVRWKPVLQFHDPLPDAACLHPDKLEHRHHL